MIIVPFKATLSIFSDCFVSPIRITQNRYNRLWCIHEITAGRILFSHQLLRNRHYEQTDLRNSFPVVLDSASSSWSREYGGQCVECVLRSDDCFLLIPLWPVESRHTEALFDYAERESHASSDSGYWYCWMLSGCEVDCGGLFSLFCLSSRELRITRTRRTDRAGTPTLSPTITRADLRRKWRSVRRRWF